MNIIKSIFVIAFACCIQVKSEESSLKTVSAVDQRLRTSFDTIFSKKTNVFKSDITKNSDQLYEFLKLVGNYFNELLNKKRTFPLTISEKNKSIITTAWSDFNKALNSLINTIKKVRADNKNFMDQDFLFRSFSPAQLKLQLSLLNDQIRDLKTNHAQKLSLGTLDIPDTRYMKQVLERFLHYLQNAYALVAEQGNIVAKTTSSEAHEAISEKIAEEKRQRDSEAQKKAEEKRKKAENEQKRLAEKEILRKAEEKKLKEEQEKKTYEQKIQQENAKKAWEEEAKKYLEEKSKREKEERIKEEEEMKKNEQNAREIQEAREEHNAKDDFIRKKLDEYSVLGIWYTGFGPAKKKAEEEWETHGKNEWRALRKK